MSRAEKNEAKRLVINEESIRTIEVGQAALAGGEPLPYASFEMAPPPDWPDLPTRRGR